MRRKIDRWQFPLLMAAGTLPLPALMSVSSGEAGLILVPVAYCLFAGLCLMLPGKLRLPAGLLLATGCVGAGVMWYLRCARAESLVMPVAYGILLMITLPVAGWNRDHEQPLVWVTTGVIIHAVCQIFLNLQPNDSFHAVQVPITVSLVVFLALGLMMLNRMSLQTASPDQSRMPAGIRKKNRLLVWIMLGVTMIIALIPAIGRMLEAAWNWLKNAVTALVSFLLSLMPAPEQAEPSGVPQQMQSMEAMPQGGPSALALVLEKILLAVTTVVVLALVVWVGRFLARKLKILWRFLLGKWQQYAASASEDYVDELQDTREPGQQHFNLRRRLMKPRISQKELNALPPREQIRRRYGLMQLRHPEWSSASTARENLPQVQAFLYERARYSGHEITPEDARTFAETK